MEHCTRSANMLSKNISKQTYGSSSDWFVLALFSPLLSPKCISNHPRSVQFKSACKYGTIQQAQIDSRQGTCLHECWCAHITYQPKGHPVHNNSGCMQHSTFSQTFFLHFQHKHTLPLVFVCSTRKKHVMVSSSFSEKRPFLLCTIHKWVGVCSVQNALHIMYCTYRVLHFAYWRALWRTHTHYPLLALILTYEDLYFLCNSFLLHTNICLVDSPAFDTPR